jgi:acyl CoA:acetate/3-ketoacid CoA transferase beta subunit
MALAEVIAIHTHEHRWKTLRITGEGKLVQSCRRSKCQAKGVYRVIEREQG